MMSKYPPASVFETVARKEAPTTNDSTLSNRDCPLFLRKTYAMVDACDPLVASWSDDGETFVVRDPDEFERTVIPQFFKHSKFTSFVRQLNFYGFRKIRYDDAVRIDRKLEAETSNFWRFRHELFRRGRPDLLIGIERRGGRRDGERRGGGATASAAGAGPSAAPPAAASSAARAEDGKGVKSEVAALRERIAAMSRNIDDLTATVRRMAMEGAEGGRKRAEAERAEVDDASVEAAVASLAGGCAAADDDDVVSFTPAALFPSPAHSRRDSLASEISDEGFVDGLLEALDDGGGGDLGGSGDGPTVGAPIAPPVAPVGDLRERNAPDPRLMDELGDALSAMPRDTQEALIRRLIYAVTSAESLRGHAEAASALSSASSGPAVPAPCPAPLVARAARTEARGPPTSAAAAPTAGVPIPLAAAALHAFLARCGEEAPGGGYGAVVGGGGCRLPVVPVHA